MVRNKINGSSMFYLFVATILFFLFYLISIRPSANKAIMPVSLEDASRELYNKYRHPSIVGVGCGTNEIYVYTKKTLDIKLPEVYLGYKVIVRKTGEIKSL